MNEATRKAMAHIKGIYPPIDDPVEAALNYSHSDGKGSPALKARFDAVCRAAAVDPMKDWLSPQDYVGGPLVVATHPTPACGTSDSAKPPTTPYPTGGLAPPPTATKPPSEALSRAIGAKKP